MRICGCVSDVSSSYLELLDERHDWSPDFTYPFDGLVWVNICCLGRIGFENLNVARRDGAHCRPEKGQPSRLHIRVGGGRNLVPHIVRRIGDIADSDASLQKDQGPDHPIFDGCGGPGRPHPIAKTSHISKPDCKILPEGVTIRTAMYTIGPRPPPQTDER